VSRHLAATIAGYALLLAAWSAARAARGRGLQAPQLVAAGLLQGALVVGGILEVARLLGGGHRAAEPTTHVGYLVASVLVLPLAVSNTSPARATRWDAAIVAVGALATAVVVLRLRVTGDA
jgi:hypothetical protein